MSQSRVAIHAKKKNQKGGTSNHFPLILYNVLEHTKTEHINEHIRKCIDKHSPPSSKKQENHMMLKFSQNRVNKKTFFLNLRRGLFSPNDFVNC